MKTSFEILLAEDNADDVFLLQQAFKKAGATSRLHAVSDGMQAMAYLNGEAAYSDRVEHPFPDIMLLDLNMPRMNGFEVLDQLRQDSQFDKMVVHVLTASCRDEDVRRAYELRVNSFVMKPSRVDELVEFVAALHRWHRFIVLPSLSAGGTGMAPKSG